VCVPALSATFDRPPELAAHVGPDEAGQAESTFTRVSCSSVESWRVMGFSAAFEIRSPYAQNGWRSAVAGLPSCGA
jgi:hypothetical protein